MESNSNQSNVQASAPVKQRGGKRPGAGRKPVKLPTIDPAAPLAVATPMSPTPPASIQAITLRKTPLERLYEAMANRAIPWATRVRAMGLAAEYVHAKQPQAVHVTSEVRLEAVVVHIESGPWVPRQNAPAAQLEPFTAPPSPPEGPNGLNAPEPPQIAPEATG